MTVEEEVKLMVEIGHASPAFRSIFGGNDGIGSEGIAIDGTENQKRHYLPRMATGELIGSFAVTKRIPVQTQHHSERLRVKMETSMFSMGPSTLSPMHPMPVCLWSWHALIRTIKRRLEYWLFWLMPIPLVCRWAPDKKVRCYLYRCKAYAAATAHIKCLSCYKISRG